MPSLLMGVSIHIYQFLRIPITYLSQGCYVFIRIMVIQMLIIYSLEHMNTLMAK